MLSTGILRSRLPVAEKIALATAGTTAEVPHSPIPLLLAMILLST
jgi:hypothetical protein